MTDRVLVEMTREQAARAWALEAGFCIIDWGTLERMREYVPADLLVFISKTSTYVLKEKLQVDKGY